MKHSGKWQNSTEGVPATMAPIAQGMKKAMQAVSDPKLAGDPDKIRALEAEIAELRRLLDQAPQDTKEEQTAKSELEEALRQIEALLKTQTEQEQKIKSLEGELRNRDVDLETKLRDLGVADITIQKLTEIESLIRDAFPKGRVQSQGEELGEKQLDGELQKLKESASRLSAIKTDIDGIERELLGEARDPNQNSKIISAISPLKAFRGDAEDLVHSGISILTAAARNYTKYKSDIARLEKKVEATEGLKLPTEKQKIMDEKIQRLIIERFPAVGGCGVQILKN